MIKRISALCLSLMALTGCVTNPVSTGDSAFQPKKIIFPRINQQLQVKAGGLVHLYADYESRFVYKINQSFTMGFMLGKIVAPNDEQFYESKTDNAVYYCSSKKVYIDPLTGPHAQACFLVNADGRSDKIRVTPGMIAMTKDVSPSVSFTKIEIPWIANNSVLKKELVFDGSENGVLSFTQKIYEKSLEAPTRLKPALVKVESMPVKISIDGADMTVIDYGKDSMVYELNKPWQ